VTVSLDGRPSTNEASYRWTVTGPRTSSSTSSVYNLRLTSRGTYTVTLVVSNAAGQKSAPATMTVTVQ
jgi:PKD repeat protein